MNIRMPFIIIFFFFILTVPVARFTTYSHPQNHDNMTEPIAHSFLSQFPVEVTNANATSIKTSHINMGNDISENVNLVGQIGGATYTIETQGSYAYINIGPRLAVFDISNPSNPIKLGQTNVMPDIIQDIALAGNYAYLADGEYGGLRIVDISIPTNPVEVGSLENSASYSAREVSVSGNFAYVAQGSELMVADISNPESPTEIASYGIPGHTDAMSVAIADNYAYVGSWNTGLHIFDISDPFNPILVGTFSIDDPIKSVKVNGGLAYVLSSQMYILDVSTPSTPSLIGTYDQSGSDIQVAGNYAYLTSGNALRVVDISSPAAPVETGIYETPDYIYLNQLLWFSLNGSKKQETK